MNRATLIGRLGKDPEVRHTQDGRPIVTLSLATSESWKDKQTGERREKTEWHRIVIFSEGIAKVAEQYLKKGSHILIEGAIQTRKWTDQQGTERYTTEIVVPAFNGKLEMLGRAPNNEESSDRQERPQQQRTSTYQQQRQRQPEPEFNDEIPF
jgi:single-strand DNA-binding protein